MPTILFAAKSERWSIYEPHLRTALGENGLGHAHLTVEAAPGDVDYIIYAPNSGLTDFTPYTRLKAVLNLWAGVEDVVGNATLKVPLARMVDEGLTEGMVEYVTGHVLRHHLGMDTHIHGQDGRWRDDSTPPLARDRSVAVLGLGVLGHGLRAGAGGAELSDPWLVAQREIHPRRHLSSWSRWAGGCLARRTDRGAAFAKHPRHRQHPQRAKLGAFAQGCRHLEPRSRRVDR